MRQIRSVVISSSVAALIAGAALAAAPANATQLSPGRALMYTAVNGPVKVQQVKEGTYSVLAPQGSKGQWMGERTNSNGKQRVRVGKLTAAKIAKHWKDFKYTKSGVLATLTWRTDAGQREHALVQLQRPTFSKAGVKFTFETGQTMPGMFTDLSINLRRAPSHSATLRSSLTPTFNIADDLWISVDVVDPASEATAKIYNATNNNVCWSGTMRNYDTSVSVKTNTCDHIAYSNMFTGTYPYGAVSQFFDAPNRSPYGEMMFMLNVSPPGESPFQLDQIITQWNWPT